MNRPKLTTVMVATWLVVLQAIPLVGACARPPSAPAPVPAPKPSSDPATVPGASPLDEIINGAKKEGAASLLMVASNTPAPLVALLRKNIREKYGVDLDLRVTASRGYASVMAQAIMETKTGAVPTYDLVLLSAPFVAQGMREGVFERVDWKSIADKGTPAEAIPQHPDLKGSIIFKGTSLGLMYNPQKVPATKAPRTLRDLADPKWQGKLGIHNITEDWARWAFILGKDSTFSYLRSIMKNKPVLGPGADLNNRYLLGEIDMFMYTNAYVVQNREKGMPTEFRALDFLDARHTHLQVRTGAQHPNAAKLAAIYLASPDGVKYQWENIGHGNLLVPGNDLYDVIVMQTRKEGIPVYNVDSPELIEFSASKEAGQWRKEAELILKGAG